MVRQGDLHNRAEELKVRGAERVAAAIAKMKGTAEKVSDDAEGKVAEAKAVVSESDRHVAELLKRIADAHNMLPPLGVINGADYARGRDDVIRSLERPL